ncbi:MAG TPA: tetratricopeptide repeat protein [Anaerolineales bacterium]
MQQDYMLKEAIEAVREGYKVRARDLLTRLLRADQTNPVYWLWMSSVVETSREQVYCLNNVLRLDPHNEAARRGLTLIGAMPADQNMHPTPLVRRQWHVAVQDEPPQGIKALWANPVIRISFSGTLALVVIALIFVGIFGLGEKPIAVAARPTKTPGPPPTFTSTPTYIGSTRTANKITPTPPVTGPLPLWMLLDATYTPTPVYVNTPHPISEDYRIGQRAFGRGEWGVALRHFRNASQVQPDAADIQYLIGEAQRMVGDYRAAINSYDVALSMNQGFAPAYLGRALASQAIDPKRDVGDDLAKAVQYDPDFGLARLEKASYALAGGDFEAAQEDLEVAKQIMTDSPLLAFYLAELALQSGDRVAALEYARQAYELDRTLLPAYRLLGEMALANGEFDTAREVLEIYVQYAEEDARGWLAMGQAYMEFAGPEQAYRDLVQKARKRDVEAAMQAFERAIELDKTLPGVYLYRAVTHLAMNEGQPAVNDLMMARRLDTNSFAINLGLGRALLVAERLDDARAQIDSSEKLAENDAQLAAIYYWRALAMEAGNLERAAAPVWEAMLNLADDSVPEEWRLVAMAHIAALTPTPTVTFTPTSSSTPTATPTRKPTLVGTSLPTSKVTSTPTQ